MTIRFRITCLAIGVLCMMNGGCTMLATSGPAMGIFQRQEENLRARNEAAADYLVQQARNFVGRTDIIRAQALVDPQERAITAPISRIIPEQVALRLIQLGYKVDVSAVSDAVNPSGYEDTTKSSTPNFILGGTYVRAERMLTVQLRMTDVKTQRVVAGFDYDLPYTRSIGDQSTPKAKIFRTEKPVQDLGPAPPEPVSIEKLR